MIVSINSDHSGHCFPISAYTDTFRACNRKIRKGSIIPKVLFHILKVFSDLADGDDLIYSDGALE